MSAAQSGSGGSAGSAGSAAPKQVRPERAASPLEACRAVLPQVGTVAWIGLRPARRAPLVVVPEAQVDPVNGLAGDRYTGSTGKRHVTLVNAEHLALAGALLGRAPLEPGRARRNVVVTGINLNALVGRRFALGDAVLEGTGTCEPCEHMEATFGPGAFNAMTGHGGITARVLRAGVFRLGDAVRALADAAGDPSVEAAPPTAEVPAEPPQLGLDLSEKPGG